MMKGVLDPKSLPLVVKDVTMLGRPACSLAYKLNMGGQRCVSLLHITPATLHPFNRSCGIVSIATYFHYSQVEQTWTENRGRSFIVTRAGPGTRSLRHAQRESLSSLTLLPTSSSLAHTPTILYPQRMCMTRTDPSSSASFSPSHSCPRKPRSTSRPRRRGRERPVSEGIRRLNPTATRQATSTCPKPSVA
jgi:hypothetical protein